MNIRILPLPKGGKKGGSILSTIGRYSRPFIKQILRMGLDKLKKKAISRIKQGGENLSKLVTMQQQPQQSQPQISNNLAIQSKKGGYKAPDVPSSFIHSPFVVEKRSIKRKKRKKSKKIHKIGGRGRKKSKKERKVKNKRRLGGKRRLSKTEKLAHIAGGKKKSRKKRKSASVFDRL